MERDFPVGRFDGSMLCKDGAFLLAQFGEKHSNPNTIYPIEIFDKKSSMNNRHNCVGELGLLGFSDRVPFSPFIPSSSCFNDNHSLKQSVDSSENSVSYHSTNNVVAETTESNQHNYYGELQLLGFSDRLPFSPFTAPSSVVDDNPGLKDIDSSKKASSCVLMNNVDAVTTRNNSSSREQQVSLCECCAALHDDEKNIDSHELHDFIRQEVLISHQSSNITLTRSAFQCLKPRAWLNDEVINLYFALLKEREIKSPKKFLTCHYFSTFFYQKLTGGKNGYDFKSVRRWTLYNKIGYKLLNCNKIFVPIHKDLHWTLAVINVKDKCFQYFDSLRVMDAGSLEILARYFMDEVKDKNKKIIDVTHWKRECVTNIPKQKNGFDCGMFLIKYADFNSREVPLSFTQEDMASLRKRTIREILNLKCQ